MPPGNLLDIFTIFFIPFHNSEMPDLLIILDYFSKFNLFLNMGYFEVYAYCLSVKLLRHFEHKNVLC